MGSPCLSLFFFFTMVLCIVQATEVANSSSYGLGSDEAHLHHTPDPEAGCDQYLGLKMSSA